jgi:hypothetical protein
MILNDAYAKLRRLGLVADHAAFSTGYLNMGRRYFDDLTCSQRVPSVTALLSLYMRTEAIADAFAANPALTAQACEMATLAHSVWNELEGRSCSLLPARRKRLILS